MTEPPTQTQVRAWEPWKISEAGDEMKARNTDFLTLIDSAVTQIRDAGIHWDGDAYWSAYDRVAGDRDNGNKVKQAVDTLADAMICGGTTLTNYRRILFDKVALAAEDGFIVSDSWAVKALNDFTEDRETDRTHHQTAVTTALNEMLGAQTDINTAITVAANEVRTRGNSLGEGDAVAPQSTLGNNANGLVGQLHEISDPDILAPGQTSPSQQKIDAKYDYYKSLIERNGGIVDTGIDQKNMVAIRRETNTFANNGQGIYDDKAVLIWVDDHGIKHVSEYKANTDPTARYIDNPNETRDVNGDGTKELGRLPAGTYEYGHNWFKNKHDTVGDGNVFTMPEDARVAAEYDTNHDGLFNDNAFGEGGESMFWHCGREGDVASAGCQTMPPDDWSRFVTDMGVSLTDKYTGDQVPLRYTLVNENRANGNTEYRDVEEGMA
ncbi:hypothetical protein IU449_10270 [Nocardia higoensis]|uniref:Uncharacterized protein n=1 Tax=Nocardia higoensis TaxID=228599 RepID=A0ABS0D956_9NOCA|nr:hypothetical protein [Nocardia higoensis]MBF6354926.1 hypothetical protein [Nocardia higoensis]